jgi:hypothetical protein
MGRLKSTEGARRVVHAGFLLANLKAVVVLGLGTLEPNILGNRLVRHIATTRDEVAAPPQVPTPERRPQPSIILEEMVGGLPLNRLHHTTRREVGWGTQQQMDMIGPHVPVENLDVLTATDFPNQIPHTLTDLPHQYRLAILGGEHEVVVQTIDSVGGSTQFAHGRPSYRKPPEGFA